MGFGLSLMPGAEVSERGQMRVAFLFDGIVHPADRGGFLSPHRHRSELGTHHRSRPPAQQPAEQKPDGKHPNDDHGNVEAHRTAPP